MQIIGVPESPHSMMCRVVSSAIRNSSRCGGIGMLGSFLLFLERLPVGDDGCNKRLSFFVALLWRSPVGMAVAGHGASPQHLLNDADVGISFGGEEERALAVFEIEVMAARLEPG